jgi:hypothetical protein
MIASRSSRPVGMLSNTTSGRKWFSTSTATRCANQLSELKASRRSNSVGAWIHYRCKVISWFSTALRIKITSAQLLTFLVSIDWPSSSSDMKSSAFNMNGEQLGQASTLAVTGITFMSSLLMRHGQRNGAFVARRTRSLQVALND